MASPFDQLEEQEAASSVSAEQAIPEWMKGGGTPSFVTPGGMVNVPVSTLTAAAQAIPDKSPLEQIGVTPENIIPGTAAPKPLWPVTVPTAAAAKTAVGLAGAMTTPKGLLELGALFTPAAPAVSAKWIWDMVKGMGESGKDLLSKLKKLGTDPKSFSAEDIQATADDVVSFAAQAGGVKGLAGHQLGRLREWNARRMANLVDPTTGQKPFAELEQAEAETPETKTVAEAKPVLPLAAAEAEKGVTDASKVSEATEVHGDVRPLEEPARVVPVEEGKPGVQPQAAGGIPQEVPRPASEQGRVLLNPKELTDIATAKPWHLGYSVVMPEAEAQFYFPTKEKAIDVLGNVTHGERIQTLGDLFADVADRAGKTLSTGQKGFQAYYAKPPEFEGGTQVSLDLKNPMLIREPYGYSFDEADLMAAVRQAIANGNDGLVILNEGALPKDVLKKLDAIYEHPQYGISERLDAESEALKAANLKKVDWQNGNHTIITFDRTAEREPAPLTFSETELPLGWERGLPPVKKGFVRLYRGGTKGKEGLWFSDSPEVAEFHYENHSFDNPATLMYVDVPEAAALEYSEAAFSHPDVVSGKTIAEGGDHVLPKEIAGQSKLIKVSQKTKPPPPVTEAAPQTTGAAPEAATGGSGGVQGARVLLKPKKREAKNITVYHGTASDALVSGKEQFVSGKPSPLGGKIVSWGTFFTPNRAEAERYSLYAQNDFDATPKVVEAKISLTNPKVVSFSDLISQLKHKTAEQIKADAVAEGHDGFVLEHKAGEPAEYVVFDPSQISVIPKTEPTEPPLGEQGTAPQTTAPTGAAPEGEPVVPVSAGTPPGISQATTGKEIAQGETKTTPAPEPAQPAAAATTPTVGTPPPATPAAGATAAPSPLAHGIRQESREALAAAGKQAPNVPGVGVAPDAAILKGEQLNAANPGLAQKLLTDFETALAAANGDISKVGVSEEMFTVTRAHGRELLKAAEQAEQQFGPTSPQYQAAWNAFSDWQARTKPMHTAWHSAGQAQQMEVDVNTGTVTGLNQVSQGATGKALPASSVPKANIIAKKNANAEKAAQQAVFNAHRRIAVAAAEADRKGRVTGVEEKTALAKVEADAKQKALDAAQKVTFKAAERLANAEKAAQVAKSAAEKKAAEAERRRAQKEVDKQSVRTRKAASDLAKAERKALADPIGTVWKKAREIIDRQPADSGMMDPSDLVNRISEETGMSPERVARTLAQDKRTKYLMDDAWKKQLIARNLRTQAKVWAATRNIEPYKRALSKIPRLMFSLKVGLHGTVALGTHVPMVAFQPTFWKTYVRDFGKMYKMIAQPAYHQMQMDNLVRRNSWVTARLAGLVNDPFQFEDYNSPQTTISFGRLTGMGNRGYSVLKIIRQDMFDQHFDRLPDRLQKIPEVAAEIANNVNHATGVVKGRAPKGTNIALFAPRLEASRVMWLLGDPLKAADTFVSWTRATEAEKWFAKQVLKERAWVLGTMSGLLALNQGFLKAVDSEQSINWDNPMKSDWLKFKVGGLNMGYGNAMISMARLPERMALAIVNEGKFSNIVFEDENVYKIIGSYARSQASPFAGTLLDLGFGRDYAERPLPRAGYGFLEGKTNIPRRLRAQGITEPYSWVEYGAKTAAFIPLQEGLVEGWQAMEDVWDGMGLPPEEQKRLAKALVIISLMAGTGARVTEDVPY